MEASASKFLKVGDLARMAGKSVRALRLYEELDLLHPVGRTHGGFRLYDETGLTRIRWIELLQEAGLSLHQIQELLKAWQGTKFGPQAMDAVRDTFRTKLEETRGAIQRYRALERELDATIRYLETCRSCAPPRTTLEHCPQCPEDHGVVEPPALVAGFHTDPKQGTVIPLRPVKEES
jgi:MerR family transcriptional regulator, copper efflux regulator